MNRKSLVILVSIAVLASMLAVIGLQRENSASIAGASAGRSLLPGFADQAAAIDRITFVGAGNEQLVTLSRSGEQWTVGELDGYAADNSMVVSLLLALAEARIVEEKTANPDFFSRLGVEDTGSGEAAGLTLQFSGAPGTTDIILGFDHGEGQRYARLANNDQSVLIDRNPELARDPADWVDPIILSIPAERMEQVTVRHADGEELQLLRESMDADNFTVAEIPAGRELQFAGVANVTGEALASLQLAEVSAADAGTNEPAVSIEYRTFDGLVVTVSVSDTDGSDGWLSFSATADNDETAAEADAINARLGDWRYRIASFKLNQMTRRIDDLLQETAAAENQQ